MEREIQENLNNLKCVGNEDNELQYNLNKLIMALCQMLGNFSKHPLQMGVSELFSRLFLSSPTFVVGLDGYCQTFFANT